MESIEKAQLSITRQAVEMQEEQQLKSKMAEPAKEDCDRFKRILNEDDKLSEKKGRKDNEPLLTDPIKTQNLDQDFSKLVPEMSRHIPVSHDISAIATDLNSDMANAVTSFELRRGHVGSEPMDVGVMQSAAAFMTPGASAPQMQIKQDTPPDTGLRNDALAQAVRQAVEMMMVSQGFGQNGRELRMSLKSEVLASTDLSIRLTATGIKIDFSTMSGESRAFLDEHKNDLIGHLADTTGLSQGEIEISISEGESGNIA